jgi:hypothetical protein
VAQLSIYDTLCSSKNDARRTEADFDLSRFMLCVVGLSKSRQKEDSAGLPTIGKPRNGDSKTPCLTMLAKNQKINNKTKFQIIRACKSTRFFHCLPSSNDAAETGFAISLHQCPGPTPSSGAP